MNQLKSYAQGQWHSAKDGFKSCKHAINGQVIAHISSAGLDFSGMLDYAKSKGGDMVMNLLKGALM